MSVLLSGASTMRFADMNDPEYVRDLLRSPDIKEDVKLMEHRRRVSAILQSKLFRKDLEKAVASQMKSGMINTDMMAIQQLIDQITPHTKLGSSAFTKSATIPILPINDLNSVSCIHYRKGERLLRCKLASVYRIVDMCGWNRGMDNHITVRLTKGVDEFLINPLGLLFHELTASSLAKIDIEGNLIDPETVSFGIDRTGWLLHTAVHAARPDVRCIIHLGTPAAIAVSASRTGLLPVSQEAMILGPSLTYDPLASLAEGNFMLPNHHEALKDLLASSSPDADILLVRNNGILVMGKSIDEAWFNAFLLTTACEAQLRLSGVGADELIIPSQHAQDVARQVGANSAQAQLHGGIAWRRGELEFEALMRRMDSAGYRTGHVYRVRQVRSKPGSAAFRQRQSAAAVGGDHQDGTRPSRTKDVEIPPASSSFSASFYNGGEARATLAAAAAVRAKGHTAIGWVASPNTYERKDIEEIGTDAPKCIPRWKAATIGAGGTLLYSARAEQMIPSGGNPNEFKLQQLKVRERYYRDLKTAGPRSHLLDGLDDDDGDAADDEADHAYKSPRGTLLRLDPANPPHLEPGHVVMVGAASRGIIDPKQRHNVALYQSVYSPNPFECVTDDELERYKENVDRKVKGLPSLEEEQREIEQREVARQEAVLAKLAAEQAAEAKQRHKKGDKKKHSKPTSSPQHLPPPAHVRSDTSGAEASHEDTDKETKHEDESGRERRKKYKFKMPSFGRKQKPSNQ